MFIKIPIQRGEVIVRKASDGTYSVRPVWEHATGGIKTLYYVRLTKGQACRKVDYFAGRHITW